MKHNLKIRSEYLAHLLDGSKKVEFRVNDRDYQVGDILLFDIADPLHEMYVYDLKKEIVEFRVTHIHSGIGMENRYVALSVERVEGEK